MCIRDREYSLQELVSTSQFKSYEDLKTRLDYVLGAKRSAPVVEEEDTSRGELEELSVSRTPTRTPVAAGAGTGDQDEDDALSYFQKLAEE